MLVTKLRCPYCGGFSDITDILSKNDLPVNEKMVCDSCTKEYIGTVDFVVVCKAEKIVEYTDKGLTARERIESFIEHQGYTYSVDAIIDGYIKYYIKKVYVSFTMKHCIEVMLDDIQTIIKEKGLILNEYYNNAY